jgi:NAD(P)-dependent dehydrogenase (short-subunit alcohol dehydrogenase family)
MEKLIAIFLGASAAYYLLRKYFRGGQFTKNTRIDGKVVVITGANTGLGFENAIDLAKRGGKIYIACRDIKRGENALKNIKEQSGSKNVKFLQLDLASLESIKEFVKNFKNLENRLDILINNAGMVSKTRSLTKDGFEWTMGVNHLGHFYLTHLLLDLLKKSAPSRVVVLSSMGHAWAKLKRDDLMSEKSFKSFTVYCNTKLANNLFTKALAVKLNGTGVTVNCCHPGAVATDISRDMNKVLAFIASIILKPFMKTPLEGAQTQIRLAVDPELEGVTGKYFSDCKEKTPSKESLDDDLAKWLWDESMNLLKLN